jgi:prevent-host-death family protein
MATFTIRDLRQRWPVIEKAVAEAEEVVITRDGKPVAKLMRYEEPTKKRSRFNPEKHLEKMKRFWGGKMLRSSDERLAESRKDRWERR